MFVFIVAIKGSLSPFAGGLSPRRRVTLVQQLVLQLVLQLVGTSCAAMCCSVLQCVAVCCGRLQSRSALEQFVRARSREDETPNGHRNALQIVNQI